MLENALLARKEGALCTCCPREAGNLLRVNFAQASSCLLWSHPHSGENEREPPVFRLSLHFCQRRSAGFQRRAARGASPSGRSLQGWHSASIISMRAHQLSQLGCRMILRVRGCSRRAPKRDGLRDTHRQSCVDEAALEQGEDMYQLSRFIFDENI